MGWSPITIKPRTNGRKIVGQQLPTLLDVTCCVLLHTLLHVVACFCMLLRKVWNQSNFFCWHFEQFIFMSQMYSLGGEASGTSIAGLILWADTACRSLKKVGVTPHGWLFWHGTSYKREQTKTFRVIFRTLYWVWENNKSLIKTRILFHKITHLERRGGKANPPIIDGNYEHTLF